MLTRMREVYDEVGKTKEAIAQGLARTGKLVTSAVGSGLPPRLEGAWRRNNRAAGTTRDTGVLR
jgi:hypothetical protein